jgi:hypothetical protein
MYKMHRSLGNGPLSCPLCRARLIRAV